ncbi:MAG: hypothetical protein CO031_01025 [Candidatus Nealsonbacteria bacterium CG_4_9_14_0_2_um_filter_37_38]|uniref:Sensor histidine kinase n=1 Tax=Candidatus Nealsonbacteria bacterium CG_4_10_14_0_8_um_filter_37_14 TaxID=1974684 RepID=A0A2M7R752_9BACT|nr:MAG: hypothetical protein COV63_03345 [Candidatus Nealsonbacteria bacterium CG11_big_fil_rev_8_21_14_0_20_37_68]PIW92055.1 MAG: hypothetical protein COZ89_01975 [Candidatus Nealsonbacteria bacterium CG_4_8_14_3_um_filter_37_23]PIY89659.1 MAG: hypothetical protein COY73_00335 [Candidatus Nealsonbacteria bacterium CG_4_10_14_0_8_um_filter_37_14]PJC51773.1 MAG: hypothetical protein CO031_01025 [Candidatus Nealsonbacteria bacterium CG_4_9_14_0_2_um_filter_37_38]
MKIWENRSILFKISWGIVITFLVLYLIYLVAGSWIIIKELRNNILPRIIERNQEIEKILEFVSK